VTPGGNGTLVNVFDGNWETVADADARVDGAETAFAQHIANAVRPVEGFRINQLNWCSSSSSSTTHPRLLMMRGGWRWWGRSGGR